MSTAAGRPPEAPPVPSARIESGIDPVRTGASSSRVGRRLGVENLWSLVTDFVGRRSDVTRPMVTGRPTGDAFGLHSSRGVGHRE